MIRTLIVDDEPLGRRRVAQLLEGEADVEIVGLCANGQEAVAMIEGEQPDLLFLDVQMPIMNGFDVLREITVAPMPVVVFVTAYDQYALRAFDVHAFDYLLKPFDRERFYETLIRARAHVQRENLDVLHQRLAAFLNTHEHAQNTSYLKRFVVKANGQVMFVPVDTVDWIEAAGNYVKLHVGKKHHLIRETLSRLEERLDPECFVRIHRSLMVHVDRIRSVQPVLSGEYIFILHNGIRVQSGRTYKEHVQALLQ